MPLGGTLQSPSSRKKTTTSPNPSATPSSLRYCHAGAIRRRACASGSGHPALCIQREQARARGAWRWDPTHFRGVAQPRAPGTPANHRDPPSGWRSRGAQVPWMGGQVPTHAGCRWGVAYTVCSRQLMQPRSALARAGGVCGRSQSALSLGSIERVSHGNLCKGSRVNCEGETQAKARAAIHKATRDQLATSAERVGTQQRPKRDHSTPGCLPPCGSQRRPGGRPAARLARWGLRAGTGPGGVSGDEGAGRHHAAMHSERANAPAA